ncbi:MAG: cobalamin biosynthesis protein [Syntrophaceae bacterium PtaU1.Bin231]|nr:MAG: cobalamin biosynthesis protein [Syntrophaceae bacterium PtaU1.Bin231]
MKFEYQIIAAFTLDLAAGDPRWMPHPVRFIGRFAAMLEGVSRRYIAAPRLAGIATALTVIAATAVITWGVVRAAGMFHPLAGDIVAVLVIYTALAGRDLADHSGNVCRALESGDLAGARQRVSWMVGRDTGPLDETGIVRAAVESVAENTVDGVIAPLFYAMVGGPVGAMIYKSVNTLDSTFGYRNERYLEFGWASARSDDLLNFIPARMAVLFIAAAAFFLRLRAGQVLLIALRDGRKHPSPNSAWAEAAMAGALGVRLGGPLQRKGKQEDMPFLGEPLTELKTEHIRQANALMFAATGVAVLIFTGFRILMAGMW